VIWISRLGAKFQGIYQVVGKNVMENVSAVIAILYYTEVLVITFAMARLINGTGVKAATELVQPIILTITFAGLVIFIKLATGMNSASVECIQLMLRKSLRSTWEHKYWASRQPVRVWIYNFFPVDTKNHALLVCNFISNNAIALVLYARH